MHFELLLPALLATGIIAIGSCLVCAFYGVMRHPPHLGAMLLETVLLSVMGGLLAFGFMSLLLVLLGHSVTDTLILGWAFLFWFGIIDTIPALAHERWLTEPPVLLTAAAAGGAITGASDGAGRIHDWKGWGWLSFPLDVTWGLASSVNGLLFHLVNVVWAGHEPDGRTGAHRYRSGFRFKGRFAITQGSVMSNMNRSSPGSGLFRHENTHVWQNRIFGPFFLLTYLGWIVLLFLPAVIAGLVSKRAGVGQTIMDICYYNNPWEVWAYRVGSGPRVGRGPMVWKDSVAIGAAVPFFILVALLSILALSLS